MSTVLHSTDDIEEGINTANRTSITSGTTTGDPLRVTSTTTVDDNIMCGKMQIIASTGLTEQHEQGDDQQQLIGGRGGGGPTGGPVLVRMPPPSCKKDYNKIMTTTGYRSMEMTFCLRGAWVLHFLISIVVLLLGIVCNHSSRKYVPVSVNKLPVGCPKAFVNVMAQSANETEAIAWCCNTNNNNDNNSRSIGSIFLDKHNKEYESSSLLYSSSSVASVCLATTTSQRNQSQFPLLTRLSRFPEAWLLPLFPLIIRVLYRIHQTIVRPSSLPSSSRRGYYTTTTSTSATASTSSSTFTFRRFILYMVLMNIRGWILYLWMNEIEDFLVGPTSVVRNGDQNKAFDDTNSCWYQEYLRDDQLHCHGRRFDFSDHVVLYFAQILPIALCEVLRSFEDPYWNSRRPSLLITSRSSGSLSSLSSVADATSMIMNIRMPQLILAGLLYLYFITLLSAFKTACYFHTGMEVLAGFAVSFCISLPLCWLQCNDQCQPLRNYFFPSNLISSLDD